MKKNLIICLAVVLITAFMGLKVYSQKMYLNIGGGYGFVASPDRYVPYNYSIYDDGTNTTYTYESVKGSGSYGKGIQLGGAFGYMITKNIGAELNIGYLFGGKVSNTSSQINNTDTMNNESTVSGNMLRFTPSIILTTGNGKFKPYMRTGMVIGILANVKEVLYTTQTSAANKTTSIEGEYTGGTSFGFAGSFGVNYMLGKRIGVFGELNIITQSWAPQKFKTTKYEVNGIDELHTLQGWEKEREYVDNYSFTMSNSTPSFPPQAAKIYLPFSSFGFNFGLHIYLDKQ